MSPLNFNVATKVTTDSFYDLLNAIFVTHYETNPDIETPMIIQNWNNLVRTHDKIPSFNTIEHHFEIQTDEDDKDDVKIMVDILAIVDEKLTSYNETWELINIRRTHIVMQLSNKNLESDTESYTKVQGKKTMTQDITNQKSDNETKDPTVTNRYAIFDESEEDPYGNDDNNTTISDATGVTDSTNNEITMETNKPTKVINKNEIFTTTKNGNIEELSINEIEVYINEYTQNTVEQHVDTIMKKINNKIHSTIANNVDKAKVKINNEMNKSITQGLSKFNEKASLMMEQHLNTIIEHIDDLHSTEQQASATSTKLAANLELVEAKAIMSYKNNMEDMMTNYTDILKAKTEQQQQANDSKHA
jgi:hypothetical protein